MAFSIVRDYAHDLTRPGDPSARATRWSDFDNQLRELESDVIERLRGAQATRQESLPSGVPTPAPTCEWRDDGDGLYEASCGLAWNFIDGTPAENNTRFCPGCGKSLIVKPAPEYDDDDDGLPTPAHREEPLPQREAQGQKS